jgi:hypothetical protein
MSDRMEKEVRNMRAARATTWAIALALACGAASGAAAQQADNPVKSVMKVLGFATDPPEPQGFVLQSRTQKEQDYIPVFQPPPEPARKVLKDKELGALKGDLDSVEKRADAIRQTFPPAAKASAEQKAQADKAKKTAAPANQ